LDQNVNFDFEIVVADDCSTDRTREIISEYSTKYRDVIKPEFHKSNIGPYRNCMFAHARASGEYIAHLDGDDYALPGKLKTQVEKLDADSACTMVWHRMRVLNVRTSSFRDDLIDPAWIERRAFTRGDLLALMAVGLHSSTMYRASLREFPMPPFDTIDYLMKVERIGDGKGYFVGNAPLGVYRAGIGIASSGNYTRRLMAQSMEYLAGRFPRERARINTAALTMLLAELKNGGENRPHLWRTWRATFHPLSLFWFMHYWGDIGKLRLPLAPG